MTYRQDLFVHTLNHLRGGKTQDELSEQLNQLVQDCRATGKTGSITLSIKVQPDKGDTGQYFLKDEIKVTKPKFDRGNTLFWGTPEGNLQRTDPHQGALDLRAAPEDKTPPREVQQPEVAPRSVS